MRIAYVAYWNAFRRDGVVKKIETQVGQWRRTGNEVRVFCLTPPGSSGESPQLDAELFAFRGFRGRLLETSRLAGAVRRFAPDVVYLRYDLFLPTIWRVFRGRPVVVEFNEQPEEYALRAARANLYEPLNRRLILRGAKGFVCIAHELASSPFLASLERPKVVIGNSIGLDEFPELPAPQNKRPRGVFLGGHGLVWHGVDKIRLLAELLPEVDFDLVGPPAQELGGPIPSNLTVHGFLARPEYEPLIASADFAIGTLALHRQNINETSPLKLREYLAYGLPVIIGHRDPDVPEGGAWYLLELPNEESNVAEHLDEIRDFVERVRGRRVPRGEVRFLDSASKEQTRLEFLARVLRDG
jgi:hypothetical protein